FGLKEKISYEYTSSNDSPDHRHDERSTQRAEPEQHVSAASGRAAAEPGPDQPGRSFAVRGTTGAVQRAQRSDFDLSAITAGRARVDGYGIQWKWKRFAGQREWGQRDQRDGEPGGKYSQRFCAASWRSVADRTLT